MSGLITDEERARAKERAATIAIGEVLRSVRTRRKLSQRVVAEQLGVSVPYISDVELGRRRLTPERLELVAAFLDDTTHGTLLERLLELGGMCSWCHGSGRRQKAAT